MAEVLTIGEVARRSGVAASALRFYEERGLITSQRAGSGHRRFPRAVLRRIAFIVFAQRIGLSLEEIGTELAKLPADRAPARRHWAQLSSTWRTRIDQRIVELERLTKIRLASLQGPAPTADLVGRLLAMGGPAGPLPPRPGDAKD